MALLFQPTQIHAQLGKFLEVLREGQAPPKFNREFLQDIGFKSSNHHAFIPLLKGLGFLSAEGVLTPRYMDFLNKTKSRQILGEAVKEAYGDIFTIKAKPQKGDKGLIAGKFKSTYNASEVSAERAAATFLALLDLSEIEGVADLSKTVPILESAQVQADKVDIEEKTHIANNRPIPLHYNIQIHLPATKDLEVYNAIFKSLWSHLID